LTDHHDEQSGLWVAEDSVPSRELQVLVYETTEAISSQWPNGRSGSRGVRRRVLIERLVRAGA